MPCSAINDGTKSAWDDWVHHQVLQAGLDIHGGLTAQEYIDEILRPHGEPHINNHALANRSILMQGGPTTHTAGINHDILTNVAINVFCGQILRSLRIYDRLYPNILILHCC